MYEKMTEGKGANMQEKITEEELKAIKEAAIKRNNAKAVAERALLEAKNAELTHQVTVQHVFMKYGLTFDDNIDDNSGAITRAEMKTAQKEEVTE